MGRESSCVIILMDLWWRKHGLDVKECYRILETSEGYSSGNFGRRVWILGTVTFIISGLYV